MKIIQILIGLTLLQIDCDRQNSSPIAESPSSNSSAAEGTRSDEVGDARGKGEN